MGSDFAELHDELRAVARELLGAADPESGVEWSLLAASGWLGLEVPEACDGAGATFAEVAVVLEEMGRTASRSAYLGSTVLGVGALVLVEAGPERDRLLRDAVAGEAVPVLALPGEDEAASAGAWEAPFRIERPDGRVIVHGRAEFVPDGAEADRLLLPARDADGRPVVVCLAAGAAGVTPTAQPVLDATRRLAVGAVSVGDEVKLPGEQGGRAASLEAKRDSRVLVSRQRKGDPRPTGRNPAEQVVPRSALLNQREGSRTQPDRAEVGRGRGGATEFLEDDGHLCEAGPGTVERLRDLEP